MPYFVKIGPFPENVKGVGSRGYHIFRRGSKVFVRWGAIEVRPGARFYWRYNNEKPFPFRTERAAKAWLAEEIVRRQKRQRYSRLPAGQRIRERQNAG
jgi:hypothetical protein